MMKKYRAAFTRTLVALVCGCALAWYGTVTEVPAYAAYGGSYPLCDPDTSNPCGTKCPNDDNEECDFNLNGWTWGSCNPQKSSSKQCYGGELACGSLLDCSGKQLGFCDGSGINYCANY